MSKRSAYYNQNGKLNSSITIYMPPDYRKKFIRIRRLYNIKSSDLFMSLLDTFEDYPKDASKSPIPLKYNRHMIKKTAFKKPL